MSGLPAVPTEGRVVTVCCGDHQPDGCCDETCAPCCPECTTCPEVHQCTPEQRAVDAAAVRERRLMNLVQADRARWMPVIAGSLARVEAFAAVVEEHAQAAFAAIDHDVVMTGSAVAVIDSFDPDGLDAAWAGLAALDEALAALAALDLPHFEGSLT